MLSDAEFNGAVEHLAAAIQTAFDVPENDAGVIAMTQVLALTDAYEHRGEIVAQGDGRNWAHVCRIAGVHPEQRLKHDARSVKRAQRRMRTEDARRRAMSPSVMGVPPEDPLAHD